ncbi:period circadian protein homolog 1b isoform X1 [Lepisosteus oculatus]|uniref:period circadian protein homolog 1b isoform X1 n=1 Tax=Lepisosteus oculatus TaxID=7918 RepID=UPI003713DF88
MSDDNSDSAPSHADDVHGVGVSGEGAGPRAGSPGLSGGSETNSRSNSSSPLGGGGGANSPGGGPGGRGSRAPRIQGKGPPQGPQGSSDDMDAHSNGNSSGNDSAVLENESQGRQSTRSSQSSSSHNCKDSGVLLETTESNKSSNSQSPSPPSSSIAYSLLSASSEQDHPSTSGCSSDQSARVKTQKELMTALKELKIRVPAERRGKGRSSTLAALQYALTCVKQVRANQEYYHQWTVDEGQNCSLDLSTYTIEELENITSEYTLKNTDTFSVAVSFITGKVVYVSPQAACILRCKPERLQGALFSKLLAPQDVSVFYSNTVPCRLPAWSACNGTATSPLDCTQEKSMFCRLSGGREREGELRYYPFRLTPYQLTLRDSDQAEPQPCCLLIAERVHSGYEAPRIPPDKRIFTTSHTPSCLFQEVDERAVPLLGYLPQDLVGTPVLLYLHPEDRPAMVAVHKKILQLAGQPLDHSAMRVCARSGEYLTIDTSWSSFINPWSRKVAFIIGRHKVRTSPLNEDVFTPPLNGEVRSLVPEIHELSSRIHRLLLQPVHATGSLGYCSVGSNGSHEHYLSIASSSDSNGAPADETLLHKPMTFQQICKDVHMVKNHGQQVFIESRSKPLPQKHASAGPVLPMASSAGVRPAGEVAKEAASAQRSSAPEEAVKKDSPSPYSYQQINCLDSIIRYLESCNIPNTVKRKCGSSSCTASSTSDDDKQKPGEEASDMNKGATVSLGPVGGPKGGPQGPAHPLTPLALHSKAESVVSITSQCSFSSTIVHVGDKKPPESDIVMMEEAPPTPAPPPPLAAPVAPPPDKDPKDPWRRVGLTKEVLSVHTQKEEQAFLNRFRDLSQLRVFEPPTQAERRHSGVPHTRGVRSSRDYPAGGSSGRRGTGRGSRSKAKRLKHQEPSEHGSSVGIGGVFPASSRATTTLSPPHLPLGPPTSSSSWPTSIGSQASLPPLPYHPGVLPAYPLSVYPPTPRPPQGPPDPQSLPPGFPGAQPTGLRYSPPQNPAPMPAPPPLVTPMVAFVLPNYMFPQLNAPVLPQPFFNPTSIFPFPAASAPTALLPQNLGPPPQLQATTPSQEPLRAPSRSSTPQSSSPPLPDREGSQTPLFQSRCSSPLNLLQLEESCSNRQEVTSLAVAAAQAQQTTPTGGVATQEWAEPQGGSGGLASPTQLSTSGDRKDNENVEAIESSNQDAMSTSSDLLDLLLQEDSRSGTGSAASGSGSSGSGSHGCSTSGSGTRSSQSSHTSKYFGSVDSSENDLAGKKQAGLAAESEQFIKYVLQDPIWLLMANTDEKVMMTYQLATRDPETVLREDREALRAMQKQQPRFSEEQKRELSEVHPWIRTGRLPRAINIPACVGCGSSPPCPGLAPPFDVELHEMELSGVPGSPEDPAGKTLSAPETAMEEEAGPAPAPHANDQEMASEEQEVTSQGGKAASTAVTDMTP